MSELQNEIKLLKGQFKHIPGFWIPEYKTLVITKQRNSNKNIINIINKFQIKDTPEINRESVEQLYFDDTTSEEEKK